MCERAAILGSDGDHVLCSKKGVVSKDFVCSRFSFDPLKFEPGEKVRLTLDVGLGDGTEGHDEENAPSGK